MKKHPASRTEYQQWLSKVDQILEEPLPDAPSDSMGVIDEVVDRLFVEDKLARPPIEIPAWGYFNRVTKGLREFAFTILCGPTGTGKTTLMANMGVQLASAEVPIFVASVETGDTDFVRKMISIVGDFDPYGEGASQRMRETARAYPGIFADQRHVFSNYDSRIPHRRLLADILYAHKMTGTKVALVDNLNFLLEVGSDKDAVASMDRAIHDFVVFCKRTPIHVVMVMHPRKTEGGRVESEYDIKGSSTAVQEASNVLLWNRVKEEDYHHLPLGVGEPSYCRELRMPKMRKGGRGVGTRIFFSMSGAGEQLKESSLV